jgi:Fe2+ transport system protein B
MTRLRCDDRNAKQKEQSNYQTPTPQVTDSNTQSSKSKQHIKKTFPYIFIYIIIISFGNNE